MDRGGTAPRPPACRGRPGYASYLHGRIETGEPKRDPTHRELVLTSADFGNAYLRDGFATRFVLELFREFTVLFIGYSINDPVMRYLVDIFATERRNEQKGQFNEAFAIASFKAGDHAQVEAVWKGKNVTPILYDDADDHRRLTEFMTQWAELRTSGAGGRFELFMEVAGTPYVSGASDSDLATAAWALADKYSRTAGRLAVAAADDQQKDADISWFGPLLAAEVLDPRDDRPSLKKCKISDVVPEQLCRWAMRHLEAPELVEWAIESESLLLSTRFGPIFFDALVERLNPSDGSRIAEPYDRFWRALVEIAVSRHPTRAHRDRLLGGGANPPPADKVGLILQRVPLRLDWPVRPLRMNEHPESRPKKLRDLGSFAVPAALDMRIKRRFGELFKDAATDSRARDDLAPYLHEMTTLLQELCGFATIIEAPVVTGLSHLQRPSILPDQSNNLRFRDLSWLIESMVLSFGEAAKVDVDDAGAVAQRWRWLWRRDGLALFGRLYLHAVTVLPASISADRLVDDLLDPRALLWSDEYRAEVLSVLELRVAQASPERQKALVERLQEAPPDDLFHEPDDEVIWSIRGQRLACLKRGGVALDDNALALADAFLEAASRSDEALSARPTVPLGTGTSLLGQPIDVILESLRAEHDPHGRPIIALERSKRVADWLREEPHRIVDVLDALACEPSLPDGVLDGIFWAFGAFKPDELDTAELIAAIDLVLHHEKRLIAPSATAAARWLETMASRVDAPIDEDRFFRLWDATLTHAPEEEVPTDENADLNDAINALGGKLAEALRDFLWQTKPCVGQDLPKRFKSRLEQLIHGETLTGLHARLVFMQALDPLFAIDPDWTREHLLPRLSWQAPFAAQALWHWRAHLLYGAWSLQLAQAYRDDFLETLGALPDRDSETFRAACERFAVQGAVYGLFIGVDARQACLAIGPEGGVVVLDTLQRHLIESDQPAGMWDASIGPWLKSSWPDEKTFSAAEIFGAIAELIIETDGAFADALAWAVQREFIRPLADRYGILWRLTETRPKTLPTDFPNELCRFLSQIIGDQPLQSDEQQRLRGILDAIERSLPDPATSGDMLARLRQL